jgi:hypothetical protein
MAPENSGGPPQGGPDANSATNNGNGKAGPLLLDGILDPYQEEREALAAVKAQRSGHLRSLGLREPESVNSADLWSSYTPAKKYRQAAVN